MNRNTLASASGISPMIHRPSELADRDDSRRAGNKGERARLSSRRPIHSAPSAAMTISDASSGVSDSLATQTARLPPVRKMRRSKGQPLPESAFFGLAGRTISANARNRMASGTSAAAATRHDHQ